MRIHRPFVIKIVIIHTAQSTEKKTKQQLGTVGTVSLAVNKEMTFF